MTDSQNTYDASYFICGTVLRDHPDVLKQSQVYDNASQNQRKYKNKPLTYPKTFDGVQQWNFVINYSPIDSNEGDWCSVAQVPFECRLNILSYKNFYISGLNAYETLLRINKPPLKWDKNVLSTYFMGPYTKQKYSVFNGYSIYDCFESGYMNGFPAENCCNNIILKNNNIDVDKVSQGTFENKLKVLEDHKELFNLDHCINKIRDKYIARHMFRVATIMNVGDINDSLETNISDIKMEIYGYGPVVAGMILYDDFFKLKYKDIYTGPSETAKLVGGHTVAIYGWGVDEKYGDYWIVYSGWNNLGLLGIVKIKCGIEKCLLEKNVVAPVPEMPNQNNKLFKTFNQIFPDLAKIRPSIDPFTFYTKKTTESILNGIICGKNGKTGKDGIVPIVRSKDSLVDTNLNFQAGSFPNEYNTQLGIKNALIFNENLKNENVHKSIFIYIPYLIIIAFIIFYICYKLFNVRTS